MAKAAWCAVSPMTGKENASINVTLPAYTGRLARNTVATVTNKNGTKPSKVITVNQAGAGNILTLDTTKPDVPKTGGTITINGTSTSSKLSWRFGVTDGNTFLPFNNWIRDIKVDNVAITNGVAITGDPGAAAKYNFVATVVLPESPFAIDAPLTLEITDEAGTKKTCVFTFKAGASTISVNKTSLNFTASGGTQTVNITSNDEWKIS